MAKKRSLPGHQPVIGEDPDGYFDWCLGKAEKGDTDSACELLHGFCSSVERGAPLPAPILNYLWMAFSQYLSGNLPVEKALLLTNPEGRPTNTDPAHLERAVATLYLYRNRDGLGKEEAKEAVRTVLGVSKRSLERADKEMHLIRDWPLDTLARIAQPPQPRAPIGRPHPKSSSDRKSRPRKSSAKNSR